MTETYPDEIAVMARETASDPWVQVEDIMSRDDAGWLAEQLESDDIQRSEYIAEGKDIDWC